MIRLITSLLGLVVIATPSWGQITTQNTLTPSEIVQNVLLGTGVTVSNIQWNGSTAEASNVKAALGQFGGTSNIGIPNGVILSCGNISEAVGPNANGNSGDNTGIDDYTADTDLQNLQPAGVEIHDGGVLEFDFIPSGDSISFQYVFGSEEYPEFAPPNNSGYNDAFGFFLTGPNPAGGNYTSQNLAVLPGGTLVSINNINPITNQTYYVDNTNGTSVEYDGFTTPLTVRAAVSCGETYHIKLAISDAGDRNYNSAVFLEANSFSSNAVEVSVVTQSGDTSIVEGCANAEIFFIRPENDTADTLIIHYDIGGTATNGTDYNQLADSVTFVPGEDSVSITITPVNDGLADSPETVVITVYTINPCGDTITSVGTLWIMEPNAEVTVDDVTIPCPTNNGHWLVATPTAGIQPYTFQWSDGSTNDSLFVPTNVSGTFNYSVTITDQCGATGTDNATVTINSFDAAAFTATPTTGEAPLVVNYTNNSTSGNSFVWNFGDGQSQNTSSPTNVSNTFSSVGNYTTWLVVTDANGCLDSASVVISVVELPVVNVPNIFTPNNDGVNDVFQFFDYQNISTFECIITNRWGNLMHEMNNIAEAWDGMTKGKPANEGVYFYTYKAASQTGQEIDGHGFFYLER